MLEEQPSEAEIREGEQAAASNISLFTIACAALYLGTSSIINCTIPSLHPPAPHAVDWALKLF